MDKFKIESEFLKGKETRNVMKSIALYAATAFDKALAIDLIRAVSLGLDGGPENFERDALSILNDLNNNTIIKDKDYLKERVKALVMDAEGWISCDQIDRELGIGSSKDKSHRRQILHRLVKIGLLERHPETEGKFRKINKDLDEVNWQEADVDKHFPIRLPFALEKHVKIFPKNLIVIAGSPNAGKTAFLLNLIEMNMDDHDINYFSSEMGPEEMKLRLSKFDIPLDSWKFTMYDRCTDFARVVKPDSVNIIDYLEIGNDFFTISDEFRKIFDNLNEGIAIIALQKKFGSSMGRGAEFGMEKPRLYLTMDGGELTIQKAKNWATKDNPNKLTIKFKLLDGCKFHETTSFHKDEVPF